MSTKKFLLEEKDIPTAWYNIVADMKNKPLPILNPQTKQPLKEEDFACPYGGTAGESRDLL